MHLTDVTVGALGSFAIVGAHLPIASAPRSRRSTAAPARSAWRSSATGPRTSAPSTRRSTSRRSGSCRSSSSARTTSTASTRRSRATTPVERLADRAAAYAMPSAADRRQRRARGPGSRGRGASSGRAGGDGPTLIEALTYRQRGHSRTDPAPTAPRASSSAGSSATRSSCSRRALAEARRRRASALDRGRANEAAQAVARRDSSGRWPGRRARSRRRGSSTSSRDRVDVPGGRQPRASRTSSKRTTTSSCSARTSAAAGGVFKTTEGLFERVRRPTACSTRRSPSRRSSARAIGAAVQGLRPVAEIMFADFAGVCFDQIANQLAKYRYMTGGQVRCRSTVRHGERRRRRLRARSTRSRSRTGSSTSRASRSSRRPRPPTPTACCARRSATTTRAVLRAQGPAQRQGPAAGRGATVVELGRAEVVRAATTSPWWRPSSCATARSRRRDVLADRRDRGRAGRPADARAVRLRDDAASVERTGRLVVVQECPLERELGSDGGCRGGRGGLGVARRRPRLVERRRDADPVLRRRSRTHGCRARIASSRRSDARRRE